MGQKYKVYVSNRPVIFTQSPEEHDLKVKNVDIIFSRGKTDILLIEEAISRGSNMIMVNCKDVNESWKIFSQHFEFVHAAGGLVTDVNKKILFIFRLSKWDLPKGKVEKNEALDSAALREVEEECSISELSLQKKLCTTYHTYIQEGIPILKATEWYLMDFTGTEIPKPQLIEGITDVKWISPEDDMMKDVKRNTYASVLDVLEEYEKNLKTLTIPK